MKNLNNSKETSKRMTDRINKRAVGKFFIFLSLFLWLVDRLTHSISITLGKIIYDDLYMQHVTKMIGDRSCKFNIDMYLAYSLFTVFLFGVLLYYSSLKKTEPIEENIENTNTNN